MAVNQLKAMLRELKESTPCADCGGSFAYYQMDFDHVPGRGEKVATLQKLLGNERAFMAELKKGDFVCRNCHAERTHRRNQSDEGRAALRDRAQRAYATRTSTPEKAERARKTAKRAGKMGGDSLWRGKPRSKALRDYHAEQRDRKESN